MTAFAGDFPAMNFNDQKTELLADMVLARQRAAPLRLLVVGCGDGTEAAVLAQRLGSEVVGIDLVSGFDPRATLLADLRVGDAMQLDFDDASFNFVYSFHALEHIADHHAALREMHRVLKAGGGYLIGTPNRDRLIGYLGSRNTSVAEKLQFNLADWAARLRGEFRNELGAHAGYALEELQAELTQVFSTAESVTSEYYLSLYAAHRRLVALLCRSGLGRIVFPAIYFYGIR